MDNKKVRSTSSQVMELQQLIAGPLIATIEADSLSSQRYLDYQSQDAGGGRTQSVSIPILTLVPLPLLQVQEADFDFDIKILDALSETAEEKFSLEEGKSVNEPQSGGGFKLRASLAPKQGEGSSTSNVQQSLSANMKVKVKMRQADMPAGLSNLLHLTASNMQVEETEAEEITEGGNK